MTLFLDTRAIIYWVEATEPFHIHLIERLWQIHADAPGAAFAVSRLSYLECLIKPLRDNDSILLSDYQAFFAADRLQIVELSASIAEQAARLCAHLDLKTPDAIQAASALSLVGEVLFITGDQQFEKVPGLKVLVV